MVNNIKNLEQVMINSEPEKREVVKVAIPVTTQDGLNSKPSRHFGRAPYYICIELEDNTIKNWDIIENPAANLEKRKGIRTSDLLKSQDVNILVVSSIGTGPFHALRKNLIKILKIPDKASDLETIVKEIPDLEVITSPTK